MRTTNLIGHLLTQDAGSTGSAPNCAPWGVPGHSKLPLHPIHIPRVEPRHPNTPRHSHAASLAMPQFPQLHPTASPGLAAVQGLRQAGGIQLLPWLFMAIMSVGWA